jgi:molybdopterin-binding protein
LPLSLAEHVCLALIVEGVSHGWALGTLLGPAGELGRIWRLSRPLTYRAIDQLVARGLVVRGAAAAVRTEGTEPEVEDGRTRLGASGGVPRAGPPPQVEADDGVDRARHGFGERGAGVPPGAEPAERVDRAVHWHAEQMPGPTSGSRSTAIASGTGPATGRGGPSRERVALEATDVGCRVAHEWLSSPVEHLRDVRTELLVKLVLRARAGLGTEALLSVQLQHFEAQIEALTSVTHADHDLVDLWRRESARAVRRFLDQARRPPLPPGASPLELRFSARNQLRADVTSVQHGDVMSTVKAVLGDGQRLTAAITKDAALDLDIAPGDTVILIVKSTEVMVAKSS